MEDQNLHAGSTNPDETRSDHDSLAELESESVRTDTNNLIDNSSNTYASHNQLGVNPGQFVELNQLAANPGQIVVHGEASYPPGYRFKPHDHQLIVHYLRRRILNKPLPPNGIHEVELYNYNPETLTAKYKPCGEKEWYFLTPRNRKYPNGDRPNRAAGDGYWKATGADKPVFYRRKCCGSKKTLVFYKGRAPGGYKTNWIMHEYKASNSFGVPRQKNDMRLDDWVLCRIHNKTNGPPRSTRFNGQQDDIDINEDESWEYDEDADEAVVPNVAGNYNPGSQLGYLDTYGNSANHQNSQTALARFSQDHPLPSFPQSLESVDLPLGQSSSYVQNTISDYEIGTYQLLDDEDNMDFSWPSIESIDQFLGFDNNDPLYRPADDDNDHDDYGNRFW